MSKYKVVIGLEVHCEVKSNSKVFSNAKNEYNLVPNTNVSVIDLGMPGILPSLNKELIHKSLKMSLALNCKQPEYLVFDRKNYFYPDLTKGYQITQSKYPVGIDGYVMIKVENEDKKVLIHDIHLEEDTASLEHKDTYSLIDYNRSGIPLLETVTEPCLNSSKEAISFLETLRNIFIYCDISEARSDRGQIRCDVNISLMEENSTELGTKVEMKNINSFNTVKLAIESEIARQTEILENGGTIVQETRRYSEKDNKTYSMRSKVDAIDYKYYTDPNLPPYKINKEYIEEIKKEIPMLQYERTNNYIDNYELTIKDAITLSKDKDLSDYFEETILKGIDPKVSCNFLTGIILGYLNKNDLSIKEIFLTPSMLIELIDSVNKNTISLKQAREVLIKSLEENKDPNIIVKESGLTQITNTEDIRNIINEVIDENLSLIEDYKNGKRVFDYFIGQVMKKSKGKANPSITATILKEELEKR